MEVVTMEREEILLVRRWKGHQEWALVFHFGKKKTSQSIPLPRGRWIKQLDSADLRWLGPGSLTGKAIRSTRKGRLDLQPESFVVLKKEKEN
jgi:maltooligosyltrehalose trehalohydrolase